MNQHVAIIGVGGFGTYVAKALSKYDFSIIAIDKQKDQIEKIQSFVNRGIVMDATDEDALLEINWDRVDLAVVAIGDPHLESSILAVALMKQFGVRRIISRASSSLHERILKMVGSHEVINPERDIANMLVNKIVLPNVLDMKFFDNENVITEFIPPYNFIGKNILEIDLRNRYRISVVAIKRFSQDPEKRQRPTIITNPLPSEVIQGSDVLVGIGKKEDFEKLQ